MEGSVYKRLGRCGRQRLAGAGQVGKRKAGGLLESQRKFVGEPKKARWSSENMKRGLGRMRGVLRDLKGPEGSEKKQ